MITCSQLGVAPLAAQLIANPASAAPAASNPAPVSLLYATLDRFSRFRGADGSAWTLAAQAGALVPAAQVATVWLAAGPANPTAN